LSEQGVRTDAVHEAYLRLTPLLSDSSRRLHGWTDEQIEIGIRRLREAVEHAKAAARAEAAPVNTSAPSDNQQPLLTTPASHDTNLPINDSLWRIENLHARLAELACFSAVTHACGPQCTSGATRRSPHRITRLPLSRNGGPPHRPRLMSLSTGRFGTRLIDVYPLGTPKMPGSRNAVQQEYRSEEGNKRN